METIIKALQNSDLDEIAELLYGDGAHEIVKSLSAEKKKKRDRAMQNLAIGTNAVGTVAGPAALYSAVRNRRGGGIPRDIASAAGPRMARSKLKPVRAAGEKVNRAVHVLNNPGTSRQAKLAAGAAGATMVGLQAVNWGGDALSAKLIADQKKKDRVKKNVEEKRREPKKIKLVRLGTTAAFRTAEQVPPSKLKEAVKKGADVRWEGEISKSNDEKRQVFGWASVVEVDGKPVVDHQEDIMELEEIEKAAYDYVVKSRKGGHQHMRAGDAPVHVSDMIESFIVTPEKKAAMGLPDNVPTGWWVGFQINDDEVWKAHKAGKLPGFSIHGSGVRTVVELES